MRVGHRIFGVTVLVAAIAALALAGVVSTAGAATSQNDSAEQAGAGTAAAPDALEKARQAMQKARQALNKARFAVNQNRMTRRTANSALALAQTAQSAAADAAADAAAAAADAANALAVAQGAQSSANQANSRLDAVKTASDTESGPVVATNSLAYELQDGPRVAVTVPQSGLIEVWASATFGDAVDSPDGLVALFEDGVEVPIEGQDEICGSLDIDNALISASGSFSGGPVTFSTPPSGSSVFGFGCGTVGAAPAPVLLQRTPGPHTYELGYAWGDCGCSSQAVFSDITLTVAARP